MSFEESPAYREWAVAGMPKDKQKLARAMYEAGKASAMQSEQAEPLAAAQQQGRAVAYLDLGIGGYIDIGSDLSDEQLAALPKGRHMLGIIGTYGVDGYTVAQQPAAVDEAAAIRAFEEYFQASSDDPYFEGELELWLTAWRKALATQHQEPTT